MVYAASSNKHRVKKIYGYKKLDKSKNKQSRAQLEGVAEAATAAVAMAATRSKINVMSQTILSRSNSNHGRLPRQSQKGAQHSLKSRKEMSPSPRHQAVGKHGESKQGQDKIYLQEVGFMKYGKWKQIQDLVEKGSPATG